MPAVPLIECTDCGTSFWRNPDEPWKTRCLPCWRKSKGRPPPDDESPAQLRYELHEALIENLRLQAQLREARRPIPPGVLKRLLSLAHPDRHGGSRIATETTTWLLLQREAVR